MYFNEKDVAQLLNALVPGRKVVILTHKNPDGDAMGSSLGLMGVLEKLGLSVSFITPTEYDHYLGWMKGASKALNAASDTQGAISEIEKAEIIFCLDFSSIGRLAKLGEAVLNSGALKVLVDHHTDPERFASLEFHRTGVSSTCELIFHLIRDLGLLSHIDAEVAQCLYVGIMTDTGSFRYEGTTPEVHRIIAQLLETGIRVSDIHNNIFNQFSEERTRFLGYCLHKKMRVLPEYRTAYITITQAEIQEFGIKEGDSEGIVNYNLTMEGIRFGVLIIEKTDMVKFSFRSIGSIPCNKFAKHFNGGGHPNASGGQSESTLEECEQKFLSLLDDFKSELWKEE